MAESQTSRLSKLRTANVKAIVAPQKRVQPPPPRRPPHFGESTGLQSRRNTFNAHINLNSDGVLPLIWMHALHADYGKLETLTNLSDIDNFVLESMRYRYATENDDKLDTIMRKVLKLMVTLPLRCVVGAPNTGAVKKWTVEPFNKVEAANTSKAVEYQLKFTNATMSLFGVTSDSFNNVAASATEFIKKLNGVIDPEGMEHMLSLAMGEWLKELKVLVHVPVDEPQEATIEEQASNVDASEHDDDKTDADSQATDDDDDSKDDNTVIDIPPLPSSVWQEEMEKLDSDVKSERDAAIVALKQAAYLWCPSLEEPDLAKLPSIRKRMNAMMADYLRRPMALKVPEHVLPRAICYTAMLGAIAFRGDVASSSLVNVLFALRSMYLCAPQDFAAAMRDFGARTLIFGPIFHGIGGHDNLPNFMRVLPDILMPLLVKGPTVLTAKCDVSDIKRMRARIISEVALAAAQSTARAMKSSSDVMVDARGVPQFIVTESLCNWHVLNALADVMPKLMIDAITSYEIISVGSNGKRVPMNIRLPMSPNAIMEVTATLTIPVDPNVSRVAYSTVAVLCRHKDTCLHQSSVNVALCKALNVLAGHAKKNASGILRDDLMLKNKRYSFTTQAGSHHVFMRDETTKDLNATPEMEIYLYELMKRLRGPSSDSAQFRTKLMTIFASYLSTQLASITGDVSVTVIGLSPSAVHTMQTIDVPLAHLFGELKASGSITFQDAPVVTDWTSAAGCFKAVVDSLNEATDETDMDKFELPADVPVSTIGKMSYAAASKLRNNQQ